MNDTDNWAEDVFGQGVTIVYPTHPIVGACLIMDRYENWNHAIERAPGSSFGNAMSDNFIPGAGDAVATALDVLKLGQLDVDAAVNHAREYWDAWERQSPERHRANAAEGRVQADLLLERFALRVKQWGTEDDPGRSSPYRQKREAEANVASARPKP